MTRKRSKKKKPISEKQRESDEKLKISLRYIDLGKFDEALEKAIKTPASSGQK